MNDTTEQVRETAEVFAACNHRDADLLRTLHTDYVALVAIAGLTDAPS